MPSEPKPYWGDEHQPFVKIGTDEKELRDLADAIVRGASIAHAEIADLRALIEAVQSHPSVALRPPKDAEEISESSKVEPTALVIHGGRVNTCYCSKLDIRVTLTAATFFGDGVDFYVATFGERADFAETTFGERASFFLATFGERASFFLATFGEGASFVGATFGERASFVEATFGERASFAETTFGEWARFDRAIFGEGADFYGATFGERADFDRATFGERANFYGATFGERADFIDCNLNRASIKDAVFDRADFRRTRGILFDETRIAQVQMEGNAPDPWSKLRRQYTGPWFFVHLILLVIFFAPYVANVLALTAASKLQENMMQYTDAADEKVQTFRREHPINGRVAVDWTNLRGRLSELETNFYITHDYLPAVWILIGGHKGWYVVVMAIIVMFYNALRAVLTMQISALRDAEERSDVTPRLDEYYGICHPLNTKEGNTWRAGIRTWLGGIWSKRLFAVPNWLRHRLPDDLQRRLAQEQPPSLIACVGLYRVHQMARVIMWIAILATAWNSLEWAKETWLWI